MNLVHCGNLVFLFTLFPINIISTARTALAKTTSRRFSTSTTTAKATPTQARRIESNNYFSAVPHILDLHPLQKIINKSSKTFQRNSINNNNFNNIEIINMSATANNSEEKKDDTDIAMKKDDVIVPGHGWSETPLQPQMFPFTRDGRLELYSSNRRWIALNKGWSRVGADGTDQFSHRTRRSSTMGSLVATSDKATPQEKALALHNEAKACRSLIAQLCELHYKFGWATGTAGGVSIRVGGPSENRPWRVFCAPSGVQKEDMIGDDIFECDMDGNVVFGPKNGGLKLSACTPIWYLIYKHRPTAMSCIHTHSINSLLATLLDPTEEAKTLKLTHLEMIKGVGGHAYDDVLEIPILDNRPSEDMLGPQMEEALNKYPKCNAILVRRHGLFVWGDSWEQAKTQAESFDDLFKTAVGMKQIGVDCSKIPTKGTYRTDDSDLKKRGATASSEQEPAAKRAKTTSSSSSSNGWNAAGDTNNDSDLKASSVPLLPRDYKYLLLDIEGCTTAISFVKDVLFPYVVEHCEAYIAKNMSPEERLEFSNNLMKELTPEHQASYTEQAKKEQGDDVAELVKYAVKNDLKVATLKSFQGKMWKDGYQNGTLKGHVYEDFVPFLEWMFKKDVQIYIYSSGSVQAQKLLFGNSNEGDLTKYFEGHFDITTSGNKKVSSSYTKIAAAIDMGISPSEICFCSDSPQELAAATQAGIGKCVMTVRPGNAPLTPEDSAKYPKVYSLMQLCGSGN